jgi:hypothetical protein
MSHALKGVEIFAVGTHNGLSFSDSDLDGIVASFTKLERASRVPLKLGHNDQQELKDGQPAYGWVERVWRDGKKLFADFVDIPKVLYEAIGRKHYKQVSIELLKNYSQSGATFPWVLDAVALLGADIPAVKGLRDLQTLLMASALPGVRFASRSAFTSDTQFTESNRMSDDNDEIKKLQAQLAAANERAEKVEKERFTEKVANHRATIKDMLETAVTEGRIFPRTRDRIVNSRLFKDDSEVINAFTVDSVKEDIKGEQRADFKEKQQNKGATSMTGSDKQDFTGMTNAQVATFKTREECLAVGGKPDNFDDLNAAQARVFKADPKLARAYFSDQNGVFSADAA